MLHVAAFTKKHSSNSLILFLKCYFMLQQLSIQNYAIIEKIEIVFPGQLTVITGETGAGKSILVGALSLVLGQRADTSVLYDKHKKCIVEEES